MNMTFPSLLAVSLLPAPAFAQTREAVLLTLPETTSPTLAAELEASGVQIGALITDRQFLASVPDGGLEAARAGLPEGTAIAPLPPEQKLQTLDPAAAPTDAQGRVAVEIMPAAGAGEAAVAEALRDLPVTVLGPNAQHGWVVQLEANDLERLAREPIVEAIHAAPDPNELR